MRSHKLEKDSRYREANDLRDWCFIGLIALASALVSWLPLLSRAHF